MNNSLNREKYLQENEEYIKEQQSRKSYTTIYGYYYESANQDEILLECFKPVDVDNGFELLLNFPIYKIIESDTSHIIYDNKTHLLLDHVELNQTLYEMESGNYKKLNNPIYDDASRYEIEEFTR